MRRRDLATHRRVRTRSNLTRRHRDRIHLHRDRIRRRPIRLHHGRIRLRRAPIQRPAADLPHRPVVARVAAVVAVRTAVAGDITKI